MFFLLNKVGNKDLGTFLRRFECDNRTNERVKILIVVILPHRGWRVEINKEIFFCLNFCRRTTSSGIISMLTDRSFLTRSSILEKPDSATTPWRRGRWWGRGPWWWRLCWTNKCNATTLSEIVLDKNAHLKINAFFGRFHWRSKHQKLTS